MKVFLLVICFCLISSPVFAKNESNYIFSGASKQQEQANEKSDAYEDEENAQQIWNDTINNYVQKNYGSEESPAFLNRDGINPNEADYGYGGASGLY